MKEFFSKLFSKAGLKSLLLSFIWVSLLVIVVDLITKWVFQNTLAYDGNSITLIPNFLHITLIHNLGASFGMGSSGELGWRIFWIAVSVILSGVLIFIFAKYAKKLSNAQRIAITLMIGGALGNMIDRIFYWSAIVGFDGVIDWIDFQFGSIHFATFNIADAALVIGVFLLIIIEVISLIKEAREKDKRGEYDIPPLELEEKQKENAKDKD